MERHLLRFSFERDGGMRERAILLGKDSVRAVLDGRKTQTRRVIKNIEQWMLEDQGDGTVMFQDRETGDQHNALVACPFGRVGDHLWVRETWKPTGLFASSRNMETEGCGHFAYAADGEQRERDRHIKWRPSIHMPRWASRITLEITSIKVERLQDISENDASAEGCPFHIERRKLHIDRDDTARGWYRQWWKGKYGVKSWDKNPFVWVAEFKRIDVVI